MTYCATTSFHMALWDSGGEVEVEAVIDFNVIPGSRATDTSPAEEPMVEVTSFKLRKPKTKEWLTTPAWIEEAFIADDSLDAWLLEEADEQASAAAEDAADAKLEDLLLAERSGESA